MFFSLASRHPKARIWEVLAVVVLQTAATIASLELPDLNARIIDEGVAQNNTGLIWHFGARILAIAFTQMLCATLVIYLGVRLAMSLGVHLHSDIFTKIHGLSTQDYHSFGASSLITRSTNDIQQIQTTVMPTFSIMIGAPIMGVGGVIMALRQDVKLSAVLLVLVPLLTVIIVLIVRRLSPLLHVQQTHIDSMNTALREELAEICVIRAFIRQDFIRKRYTEANDQLHRVALSIDSWFAFLFSTVMVVISISTVGVPWLASVLINSNELQIGSMIACINYVGMISGAVMVAVTIFIMVPRANVAIQRITEVLGHEAAVKEADAPAALSSGAWTFTFEGAAFRYSGAEEAALEGLNLTLRPGTTTATIGATASGKTTLVNLLPRMIDPTDGRLAVSGQNPEDLSLLELRSRIAMVPQKAYSFFGTIASIISGVEDPDAAQHTKVELALEGAQAKEFVPVLPNGIDHEVEPGRANFSGGQHRRLAIARALYRAAELYVFDNSLSALDYATDAKLRLGLNTCINGAAILIVGQRVISIRHAGEILVLEDGRIIGRGTYAELLSSCETYKEVVASQIKEEEAAWTHGKHVKPLVLETLMRQ